jgi:sterol desaturase/sphingolipid hydroxylase (fatty acid hydroxylase superfamily)
VGETAVIVAIVVGIALAMMVIERVWPARPWPVVRSWWPRALAINGFQIGIVFVAGATWERWLRGPHLLAVSELGWPAELAIGYAVNVLWLYWAHRARHHFDLLWRWLHQLHHSPARIEILTAFYKHPLEIVVESILTATLLYVVLGISREAAFVITNISGVAGLFYHWNVSTPRWLGYIVQRPESHCVHHEQGIHAFNYSELPLVDIAFGTFRNPARFEGKCGFSDDGERRFGELLAGNVIER